LLWMSNITNSHKAVTGDEDLEYVIHCQSGDTDAFEVLVERHQKQMLNIAFRMMGDYNEACDVTQEAFIAAYPSGSLKRKQNFPHGFIESSLIIPKTV
jgi:RNA polymerase sigma-70 factor (ECF subfamily)